MSRAIAVLVLAAALVSGCAPGQTFTATAADPAGLVHERCVRCHPVQRIKDARHDNAHWEATIARMRRRGAKVDDTEAAAIIKFLTNGGGAGL
jgi:hypothetical protein